MGVSGQRHAPAALCPGERTPGTHFTGGWVGLRRGHKECFQNIGGRSSWGVSAVKIDKEVGGKRHGDFQENWFLGFNDHV
jgi:hypothetical protein